MTRQSGALRIFLYNWPIFVGTWVAALVALGCLPWLPRSAMWLAALVATGALVWSLTSLLVSFYIYDASELVSGRWIAPLLGPDTRTWATIHAGLDAEIDLDAAMHGRCVARLDVFDDRVMTSGSITRARVRTPAQKAATPCSPTALALADGECDAIVVAFTAHEIRDRVARERFFGELRRALRPGGKALLVEHSRDVANFLAFGPGFFHFEARREWLRLASHANLDVACEARVTPWVMALVLQRAA